MKLKIGVIIGRFQVPMLHSGHHKLIQTVKEYCDQVVVLLGVSPTDGYSAENPLTFWQRQNVMKQFDESLIILPLQDHPSDIVWSKQIDDLLGAAFPGEAYQATLYGSRDSFTESYKGSLKVEKLTFDPPIVAAGKVNRAAIKEANSPDFYAGQIYALQRQWPKVYPTVDIAIIREIQAKDEVLLIQRVDTSEWSLPGGFVDPKDGTFEVAARRECNEEVGLVPQLLNYVGNTRVNDFRYRGSRDKIITTLFSGRVSEESTPRLNYSEVQDYRWEPVYSPETEDLISETHTILLKMYRK